MRNLFLGAAASAALVLVSAGAAQAQDDGGGFGGAYVGATIGADFGRTHFALLNDPNDTLQKTQDNRTGLSGGGVFGFNLQRGDLVVGIEGDVNNGRADANVDACTAFGGCWTPAHDSFTTHNHVDSGVAGRVRLRLGWVQGRNLFYVAGGYTAQRTTLNLVGDCYNPGAPATPTVYTYSRGKTVQGFNIGAGIERSLGRHWVGRAEYLYDGFGGQTYKGDGAEWADRRVSLSENTLRAGIAYRF
ncbi:outer membrane protein [Caulobacter sp. KR2-114]|uniref:outer membrane protein n=1 Tax=Caulobacter sp. KR2-114 TaxID=3400912 RepID=UPI003C049D03